MLAASVFNCKMKFWPRKREFQFLFRFNVYPLSYPIHYGYFYIFAVQRTLTKPLTRRYRSISCLIHTQIFVYFYCLHCVLSKIVINTLDLHQWHGFKEKEVITLHNTRNLICKRKWREKTWRLEVRLKKGKLK